MNIIEKELDNLNEILKKEFEDKNFEISTEIKDFLISKSKKIRPSLIFLVAKALNKDITNEILNLACSVELIHNATLIHDDIIDNADKRRGNISLNKKIGNNLSVLAGDLILSIAMKKLAYCRNIQLFEIFSEAMSNMCKGEINQNFSLEKIPTLEEYIKKSKAKTAELFEAGLIALCKIANIKEEDKVKEFAQNYGIAFQIKDDLINVLNTDKSKPAKSDIYNGIYTAPVIFLNSTFETKEELYKKLINNKTAIKKTEELIKNYTNKALEAISFLPENEYKKEIIKLTINSI